MVGLQPLQRPFDLAHDVVAREPLVVGTFTDPAGHLGGDHQIVALALHGPRQHYLRTANVGAVIHRAVNVGTVDQIDALVDGMFDQPLCGRFIALAA